MKTMNTRKWRKREYENQTKRMQTSVLSAVQLQELHEIAGELELSYSATGACD